MIEILKISYDDKIRWCSKKETVKKMLLEPNSPELFIIYKNDNGKMEFDLLTDLEGRFVLVCDEIIKIPELLDN